VLLKWTTASFSPSSQIPITVPENPKSCRNKNVTLLSVAKLGEQKGTSTPGAEFWGHQSEVGMLRNNNEMSNVSEC